MSVSEQELFEAVGSDWIGWHSISVSATGSYVSYNYGKLDVCAPFDLVLLPDSLRIYSFWKMLVSRHQTPLCPIALCIMLHLHNKVNQYTSSRGRISWLQAICGFINLITQLLIGVKPATNSNSIPPCWVHFPGQEHPASTNGQALQT